MVLNLPVNQILPSFRDTPSNELLIDSNKAASFLGIHPKTLQRLARDRKVPAHRIGKLWRFRISELDEWLRRH